MQRANPTGMAGTPSFEEVERFGAAHLADRNTVGPKAKRRAHEVGKRGGSILRAQRDQVRRGALQLARILDQHHPVARLGDLGEQCIDQRGLAGRGAAGDEDVLSLADALSQQLGLNAGHDAGVDVVPEGEHRDRRAPDGEARRRRHRRNKALEPLPAFRQLGGDPGAAGMDLDANVVGDEADDALGVGRA